MTHPTKSPAARGVEAGPSLLYLLKRTELVVRARLEELVRPAGITALQYTALTVLERHDGISAAQLARDSFVTAQSMADMVRALEARDLIRREANPANRREKVILLTDTGRRLLTDYTEPARRLERRMVQDLSREEVTHFRDALKSAHRALS
ncbi:MarR family winged helix-turn-helix transcriptional regulator [Streptomyces sp. MMG1121]|uniref:MarR family winged helix-turn-helix transcriptional regulator n=1 Tax=Streptomyces sp. MMG1121 TaxID=1415544 RepID=UPI0006B01ADF|nr:MarR family transcriptional regulator [Streptomyces sp. MMG1121]KOV56222.1 MarR family transcriptional regulator [Streptomyces sp. MMG1121]